MGRDHGGAARAVRARGAGRTDDDLDATRRAPQPRVPRRAGRSRPRCAGWTTRTRRWGSCTPADRSIRLSDRLQDDAGVGGRLRAGPRAGAPARAGPRRTRSGPGSTDYPRAERAKGYLEGGRAAAGSRPAGRWTGELEPVEPSRASRDQVAHVRLVGGQRVDRPPAHVERLLADRVLGAVGCRREEADVEVRDTAARVAERHGVHVEVHRRRRRAPGRRPRTPRCASRSAAPARVASPRLEWPPNWNQQPRLAVQVSSTWLRSAESTSALGGEVVGKAGARAARRGARAGARRTRAQRAPAPASARPSARSTPSASACRLTSGGRTVLGRRRRCRRTPSSSSVGAAAASKSSSLSSAGASACPRGSRAGRRGRRRSAAGRGAPRRASRASAPWRERSEPHSVEASRSRRGRSSRPTSAANVCSAGPPAARRRRTASCSLAAAGIRLGGGLADDLVDPALDQRERGLEPLERGLLLRASPRARTARPPAPPGSPPGWSGRCRASTPRCSDDVDGRCRGRSPRPRAIRCSRSHGTCANSRWWAASRSAR